MTTVDKLRQLQPNTVLDASDIFDAIVDASSSLVGTNREDGAALEIAIRLLEARRNNQVPDGCLDAVEMLAEECGLYPYLNSNRFTPFTQAVIEAHTVQLDEKIYLHSKQMEALLWLLNGDNLILSAPTSFGKSMLIDAFLGHRSPEIVVMLLPTIALIDETRRRLTRRFGNRYRVVTTVTDSYEAGVPTIFVLTQERFLQRRDEFKIDLLFVDEFYKLDPVRKDERFENLNIALYRALPRSKQCFMAGPHIKNIFLGERYRGNFRFVQTDYRTVSVNIFDRSNKEDKKAALFADLKNVGKDSSIIFTATPGSAQTIMRDLVKEGFGTKTTLGDDLANWIKDNYHPAWPVGDGTERGIAVHHGRLPRSLGQVFIQLFDKSIIKTLICTSTLIEGVNTSAANVFIYDKKISHRDDLDFFSFANIRGRVGRMMRHFVGKAFLYYEPPSESETIVEVPILSDPGSSTDYIVMNVDEDQLSVRGRVRKNQLPTSYGLSAAILKEHGAIGFDNLMMSYNRVEELLEEDESQFWWSGRPNKEQRIALADIALKIARAKQTQTGLHTPKQVAWGWAMLEQFKTLPEFLGWFAKTFYGDDEAKGVDEAFRFLQACEYGFPRSIAAIEALVRFARPGAEPQYGPYIVSMENWFRPAWMKQVDEAGIPLPLAERLSLHLTNPIDRNDAMDKIASLNVDRIEFGTVDRLLIKLAREN